jgi:hypothetical protein
MMPVWQFLPGLVVLGASEKKLMKVVSAVVV